ncbi:MAG: (Fe-S)-binding protein [Candidatus Tectomicrobia bacterium]|uniref:Glycolate oxidase iron-sulfur subunit n=1 Tax=Tectimicrobiota bacterium TaxID=2528274 RepID=A0A933GNL9_UNCTE|nr:(Fe-S)-binding protein [Candidatus Tectomicrobia bacterium]
MVQTHGLLSIYDEVAKCNRCGFCQAQCPIYFVTGQEGSVARGHNAHLRSIIEGKLDFNEDLKAPLFECLLCRSCVANCFPAIKTDENVIVGRSAYNQRFGQSRLLDFIFKVILLNPRKMAFYLRLAAAGRNSRIMKLAQAFRIFKWFGRDLDQAIDILPGFPDSFLSDRIPESVLPSLSQETNRVAYFMGCGVNYALPEVGEATINVLRKRGCRVEIVANNCCGLPPFVYGDLEAARRLARRNIDLLKGLSVDAIVTDCASCLSFLKDYPKLLAEEHNYVSWAEALTGKTYEFSDFFQSLPGIPVINSFNKIITYHDPCHLSRYQSITQQPRDLIKSIPGADFKEMPEANWCCGAAGTYNVTHFQQSMKILDRKVGNITGTGAGLVVTSCPACLLQLNYGVKRNKLPIEVCHLSQLIDKSLQY